MTSGAAVRAEPGLLFGALVPWSSNSSRTHPAQAAQAAIAGAHPTPASLCFLLLPLPPLLLPPLFPLSPTHSLPGASNSQPAEWEAPKGVLGHAGRLCVHRHLHQGVCTKGRASTAHCRVCG